jgi:hypothetical protein|eukprot:COSAG01_NODE_8208_length_2874_cov_3.616577_3_plen_46_part_00
MRARAGAMVDEADGNTQQPAIYESTVARLYISVVSLVKCVESGVR